MLIDFDEESARARITREPELPELAWDEFRRQARELQGATMGTDELQLPWASFLGLTRSLVHLQKSHGFTSRYSAPARARIDHYVSEVRRVAELRAGNRGLQLSRQDLKARLAARGWDFSKRELTNEQYRDCLAALATPNSANFSVPGAGKTSVALALYLAATPRETRLLVVAPKNAFVAWDQALEECLTPVPGFVRLEGGARAIRRELSADPTMSLLTYSQLVRAVEPVAEFMRRLPVHFILDESHRIKAGDQSLTGTATLALAPLAVRRDILSGTPMPNAAVDLAPQLDFLWPGQALGSGLRFGTPPASALRGLFVRTTQAELGLPDPIPEYVDVEMSDAQKVLYGLFADQLLRQLAHPGRDMMSMDLRRSVMRLLQAAIDPQAAVRSVLTDGPSEPQDDPLRTICNLLIEEDVSPRMSLAESLVREIVTAGRKVVVWAPFTYTIERFASRLSDLGAVFIHGGVGTGDDTQIDTREGIVRRFHDDPYCRVLVANPAAGGEGISLHRVCHDAVYIGRTYNAAHYLQSRYRIHRLGLPPDATTRIWHVEVRAAARLGSVDLSVRRRLDWKIDQMAQALNDPDLRQLALESEDADPRLDDGLTVEDLIDLYHELTGTAA